MEKRISLLCMILAICILFTACGRQGDTTIPPAPTETSTATTEPTTVPATEPTTAPTTEPAIELPTGPPHTHTMKLWYFDYEAHQYACSCGETITEPHALDETDTCVACAVQVCANENGYVLYTTIDTERVEDYYQPVEPGSDELYEYMTLRYYENGHRSVTEYGTHGNITSVVYYDANGAIYWNETRTYTFDEQGGYEEDGFIDGELRLERTYIMGPDGERHLTLWIDYGKGVVHAKREYELEFDESGLLIYQRCIKNGAPYSESFYTQNENGRRYVYRAKFYHNNIVIDTYYDEYGQTLLSTRCYSDGTPIES